jgi:hypothetical protein
MWKKKQQPQQLCIHNQISQGKTTSIENFETWSFIPKLKKT